MGCGASVPGADMLGELDGVQLSAGSEKDVPELATKAGAALVGLKFKSNKDLDMEFGALVFNKSGELIDQAAYRNPTSKDGSVEHQGDSTGDEPEYIKAALGSVGDDVQAIIFCTYIYTDGATFNDISEVKLVLKVKGGEEVIPVCYIKLDLKGDFSGAACLALYKVDGKWKVKNVSAKGSGPDALDMVPGCKTLFKDLGIQG